MKELSEILEMMNELPTGASMVLATVVDLVGSSYRLPGAKMAILGSGRTSGTVSGGCIEADVLERAQRVLDSGRTEVFLYDTTNDEDPVFGFNTGCKGKVRVLLERISPPDDYIDCLRSCFYGREERVIVTLVSDPLRRELIGSRWYFDEASLPEREGGGLPKEFQDLRLAPPSAVKGLSRNHIAVSGEREYFVEYAGPSPMVCIFGAGSDAIPLARLATGLGWQVSVVDHRPAYLKRFRSLHGVAAFECRPADAADNVTLDQNTAAIVMSHNLGHDREYLRSLFRSDVFYIGALGPGSRTREVLSEIEALGVTVTEEDKARLKSPVGLDIGADTPELIALSILSEIQAVFSSRAGGFLAERAGPIYSHPPEK